MSNTTITGAGIFNCPTCNEMIYSDARFCRFCSAPVDRGVAERSARLQAQVNNACNQAKLLRHAAMAEWVFFVVSLISEPVEWALLGLTITIPVWLIEWQFLFGKLKTNDPDFEKAKRDRLVAFIIWLPAAVTLVVLTILAGT
jgi:hypothetical protein